jgi:hypothetical protein
MIITATANHEVTKERKITKNILCEISLRVPRVSS